MDKAAAEPSLPLTVQAPSADVRRQVSPAKPLLRGWLHLVWFEASLVLGTLTLARAHGAVRIAALAIFAVSVSAMFGVSALYHRGDWTETWRRRLQRLDHAMIFLLIAGTATPAFLLATRGVFRISCLIVVWALTLTAGAIHMAWMGAPEPLVGSTFVGLGWVGGLALPGCGCIQASRRGRWFSPAGCLFPPEPSPIAAAGLTRIRRSSATTRSFTSLSVPPRPVST